MSAQDPARAVDPARFIRANTELLTVPLVPEISLYLASEAIPLWEKTEEELGQMGLPPPFWAFAWAGGQALARYLLDNPETVRGKSVLDIGSGSGLTAIAAAKAGAAGVLALEVDRFAIAAIEANRQVNTVKLEARCEDVLDNRAMAADIVLVGDLFYEKPLAERALAWLRHQAAQGADVLIGDPGRSYLPRDALEQIAAYQVPVTRELEDLEIKNTGVWRLRAGA